MTEEDFLDKCIKIMKSFPSDDAKKKISLLNHPTKNGKIGSDGAEKIFFYCAKNHCIEYEMNKDSNKEKEYINKLKKFNKS
jgi:hypothetical protein